MKGKIRASALHFLLSGALLALPLIGMTWYFYPGAFFWLDGGFEAIKIALLLDLGLGPGLTFVLYKASKSRRELTLDLGLVALVQLAAFGFGVVTMLQQRPIAFVFDGTLWHSVAASQLRPEERAALPTSQMLWKRVIVPGGTAKEKFKESLELYAKEQRPFHVFPKLWGSPEVTDREKQSYCFTAKTAEKIKTEEGRVAAKRLLDQGAPCVYIAHFRYANALVELDGEKVKSYAPAKVGDLIAY